MLLLAQLRREGRKPVSFCCGIESVYIKAVWGVSMATLRVAASYASGKGVDDVQYHAPPFHTLAPSINPLYGTEKV